MSSIIDATTQYMRVTQLMQEYHSFMVEQSSVKHPDKLQELADKRHFDVELLHELGVFYVGDMVEMLHPNFIDVVKELGVISETNNMPIFNDRYVIPIKDVSGNIINFVGYTWKSDVRYVYGTGKYYERAEDFFGAEEFSTAMEMGWAVVVEGITDKIALNNAGIKNAFAMCGTARSDEKMWTLSLLDYGVIFIHDRDKAGDETRNHWVVPRYAKIDICGNVKDIDEYLNGPETEEERLECKNWLHSTVNDAVNWLKQGRCRGQKGHSICEGFTLL